MSQKVAFITGDWKIACGRYKDEGLAFCDCSSKERKRPAPLPLQFEQFPNAINLDKDVEQRTLTEKQEVLLRSLADGLLRYFPKLTHFVQGRFAIRAGVVPLDGNYDIDVAIIFECFKNEFPDPVASKRHISDGRLDYHLDLALYVRDGSAGLLLANGREFLGSDQRQPIGLACVRFR